MSSADRFEELDAVRGIAACVVVLHHCWQAVLPDQNTFPFPLGSERASSAAVHLAVWLSLSPFRLLFAGRAAVGIFFVLSGFVLTKSLQGPRETSYPAFIVRRFFRIWLPFAVVIFFAAALCVVTARGPIAGRTWINESWNSPITAGIVLGHLLMFGFGKYVSLDNPMWSLVHELRISLIFPLVAMLTTRLPRLVLGVSLIGFVLLSLGRVRDPIAASIDSETARELLFSFVDTIRYGLFFVLGILLAINLAGVGAWLARWKHVRALMWLAVACLLWLPYRADLVELAYALGAFGLLALCISSTYIRTALRHPVLGWLGKVSYSLYLLHLVVLLALLHLLMKVWPIYVILPIMIVSTLILAGVSHRYLEAPSNNIGKRLALRLKTKVKDLPVRSDGEAVRELTANALSIGKE